MSKKSPKLNLPKLLFHSGPASWVIISLFIILIFSLGFRLGRAWTQRLVDLRCPTQLVCLIPNN